MPGSHCLSEDWLLQSYLSFILFSWRTASLNFRLWDWSVFFQMTPVQNLLCTYHHCSFLSKRGEVKGTVIQGPLIHTLNFFKFGVQFVAYLKWSLTYCCMMQAGAKVLRYILHRDVQSLRCVMQQGVKLNFKKLHEFEYFCQSHCLSIPAAWCCGKNWEEIIGYQSGDKLGSIHAKTVAKNIVHCPFKGFCFICVYYYNSTNHASFGFRINRLSRITALILYII